MAKDSNSLVKNLKNLFIGRARNPQDARVFHSLSLVAFFAWVGLGADGLSSSCYGPQEAFLALGSHHYLSLIVALATVLTIFIISASYTQIIELFPSGGGGYLVASKLLSPTAGMVSGCALIIDYVLTITVSVASGTEALFSLLPLEWQSFKLIAAVFMIGILTLGNLRGVKESVIPLVPLFILFLLTHAFLILYGIGVHSLDLPALSSSLEADAAGSLKDLGMWGTIFLILKAYSMGAGTYTGIEAVSNSTNILREPRVQTAKVTMRYMAISLAVLVMGLMLLYLLFDTKLMPGKTLNASLLDIATAGWSGPSAGIFIFLTLFSEASILFVAAQTGFLGAPRVLANMAIDRWFPSRFSSMSDRLVTQNGVLIMGIAAIVLLLLTHGSVQLLVVLYSINVFITFALSQMGMVRHWWNEREVKHSWKRRMAVNGTGLILTLFILLSMVIMKFNDGGWMTLLVTGSLIALALWTKRHYQQTSRLLKRLNGLVKAVSTEMEVSQPVQARPFNMDAKTAIVFVNGFNGMGLHTLFNVVKFFGGTFKNFVFIQVGVIDAGNFKGAEEVGHLQEKVASDLKQYCDYMSSQGCYAKGLSGIGVDLVEKAESLALQAAEKYPGAVFFGGQLLFPQETFANRLFHNYTVFALQERLYRRGLLFVILPIRV